MVNTERVQRPVSQGKSSDKPQGKPGLMQRLRALPARDWLLIAIGAGTLVVAWLAYRRNSSSNTLPNLLTDPAQPIVGGGGGATDNTSGQTAAGQQAVNTSGPVTGIVLDNQQQQQQQGGPINWGSQVVPSGNYPGTDSGSDPTYGANIKVVPTAQTAAYQHYTDASSDPTYGKVTTPAASVSATATQQSRNNVAPAQPHQAPAVTPSMPLGVLIKRGRQ